MHAPDCDLLSVMAGYELADSDTRAKIDALIAEAFMHTLSESDPIAGKETDYEDIREKALAAQRKRISECDPAKAE